MDTNKAKTNFTAFVLYELSFCAWNYICCNVIRVSQLISLMFMTCHSAFSWEGDEAESSLFYLTTFTFYTLKPKIFVVVRPLLTNNQESYEASLFIITVIPLK